ncbi:MAG: hypothetical protein A3J93_00160 [Candidatus Magasanikbacteria bacterium RIFOXYC2_FULL_42_28]|uniref:Flavoprotein n=1 Tax=Candidatus Magasanikbacteria bacterium RIFOXYC2_FULL_42_28 TaxID=1798704 RepID=A0A1F6NWQ0_9BACT|nr:MAG: hypothetical protein A3J93_00160 [Candidatus Magasanikbacteria bacterium RIFOXYC2_FULL_42_28]
MKTIIIGGGAAGMMAAATICEGNPEAEVILIEKNSDLGRKVIISGGGRCNVTTGTENPKEVLLNYPRGNKFLISAMFAFGPRAVRAWFEDHNVPLKCEDDGRVFPVSDHGEDVVGAFKKIFARSRIQVVLGRSVVKMEKENNTFKIFFKDGSEILADTVVLALGGQAYRHTGSTGDGYTLAEALGHTITKLAPSLHSFVLKEAWMGTLAGMSFVKATISADCSKPNSRTGPFLFTHKGISGPAVFAVSSLSALTLFSPKNPLPIFIDFLPEIKIEDLKNTIQNSCRAELKKNFKNTLHQFVPLKLVESLALEFNLPINKKNAEISKAEISLSAEILKNTMVHAVGYGAGEEFVTAGGVELTEIDPKTMESKKCEGLFFAGEILNVDGFTGGFNLQAAWATGRLAGVAILADFDDD